MSTATKKKSSKVKFTGSSIKKRNSSTPSGNPVSTVYIEVISGKKLTPVDTNGLSDPYVTITFEEEKYRTKTQKKTLEPVWNETFSFNIYQESMRNGSFIFTCWDWDKVGQKTYMGSIVVSVRESLIYNGQETDYQLFGRGKGIITGTIRLKFNVNYY